MIPLDALAQLAEARLRAPPGCWEMRGAADWAWRAGLLGWGEGRTTFAGTLVDGAWRGLSAGPHAEGETRSQPLWGSASASRPTGARLLLDALDRGSSLEHVESLPTGLRWVRRLDSGRPHAPNELTVDFAGDAPVRWALEIHTPVEVEDGGHRVRVSSLSLVLYASPEGAPLSATLEGRFAQGAIGVWTTMDERWTPAPCD
ncbi:MAG: hypothetical protein ACOZNI_02930 [Myxococcota bacterium]